MSLGLQATVDVLLFFTSHESGGGDNLFLPVFLSPTFFACKLAPAAAAPPEAADRGGGGAPGTGRRGRRRCRRRVPARDHAPRPAPRPHHLYFNLSLNSLLFLLPLPAPPLSRSSADEIGPQARRPGSEGTADLAVSGAGPPANRGARPATPRAASSGSS